MEDRGSERVPGRLLQYVDTESIYSSTQQFSDKYAPESLARLLKTYLYSFPPLHQSF